MYLAKLTIHGFKSFAKKTELTFSKGLSAIVGPNGCGKTNIVDAIRWVIGEQKVKSLRSSSMVDVIFKGSREHKPLGMAEVQLTLKDCKGLLPFDPMEETVVIGRRFFRSGDSEYLINGRNVRLKDIHSILMGTGIGSSVYALIEQSMIQRILSGRKDDRRALFEEAAGIMKYNVDRKSSESKLARTGDDLERLGDIIIEVKKNVDFLNRQTRRAKDLERLQNRSKKLAVNIANDEYRHVNIALADVSKELSDKEEKLAIERARRTALETQRETLSLKRNERESLVSKAGEDLRRVGSKIASNEKEHAVLEERIANAKKGIESALETDRSQTERVRMLDDGIEKSSGLLFGKMAELEKFRALSDRLLEEQAEAEKRFTDIRGRVEEARGVLAGAETGLARTAANAESAATQIEALDKQMADIREWVEKDTKRLAQSQKPLELSRTRLEAFRETYVEAKNELETRDEALSMLLDEKSRLFGEIGRLTGEIGGLRGKLEVMEEAARRGELGPEIRKRLESIAGAIGRVADLVQPGELTAPAMDSILGELAKAWVFEDASGAEIAVRILRESGDSAVLIVLDELPQPGSRPVGAVAGAERLISLMEGFSLDPESEKSVTADGDFMRAPGIRKIGRPAAAPVTRIEELKALRSKLAALEVVERELRERLESVEASEERSRRELNDSKSRIADVERNFRETERSLRGMEFEAKSLEGSIGNAEERLLANETRKDELKKSVERFDRDESKNSSNVEAMRKTLEEQVEKQNGSEIVAREKARNATSQQMNYVRQNGEKERLEREIERMQLQKGEAVKSSEKARARAVELQAELDRCRLAQGEIGEMIEGLFSVREKAENALSTVSEEVRKVGEALRKVDIEFREALSGVSTLEKTVHEKSMEKHDHEIQAGWIEKNIMDEYSIDIAVVELTEEMSELAVQKARGKLDRLKEKIADFGGVDPEAEAKFEEERARFDFLSDQRADLLDASGELRKTIRRLDNLARAEFTETFEKTRINFRLLFTELFEGGEADLRLQEGVDVLEADIEISARPRGKRFLSIDQLSAGEKALCALSLLFGLYKVKPSPFCMLDEVDAPLDDANVNRFLKLIRQFSIETQFILITHNKRTMETTDYLYGVTMQEHGISKVISLKFSDLALDFGD